MDSLVRLVLKLVVGWINTHPPVAFSKSIQSEQHQHLMLYSAYGSMMDFREMRQRCPSAQFVAVAKLLDHLLQFTRR